MEIGVFVSKIENQRFSSLFSQTRPHDSNISVLYSKSSLGLKTTNVPSGSVNGELTVFLCLSRPDLPDYPIPPLPTHATCNYAKSRDHVPGKAHPSPPVEHEYHSIDVNYKRATCATSRLRGADRTINTMHPPADYKCVCLLFAQSEADLNIILSTIILFPSLPTSSSPPPPPTTGPPIPPPQSGQTAFGFHLGALPPMPHNGDLHLGPRQLLPPVPPPPGPPPPPLPPPTGPPHAAGHNSSRAEAKSARDPRSDLLSAIRIGGLV